MIPFKKTILATFVAAASPVAIAAGPQAGGFDLFVSGGAGYTWFSDNGPNDKHGELRASVAYTDKSGFGGQIDNVYSRQNLASFLKSSSTNDFAAHGFYRTSNWQAGIFWQNRSYDIKTGDASGDAFFDMSSDDQKFYGVEAQGFFGDLTVSGKLGQHKFSLFQGNVKDTGTLASIGASYFLNDNLQINASFMLDRVKVSGTDVGSKQFGLGTEYRLTDSPLSVFAQYSRTDNEMYRTDEDRLLLGVKLNFGKESLRKRDREGANSNPVQGTSLPPISFFGPI